MDWYIEPQPRFNRYYIRTSVGGILTMIQPVVASVLITFVVLLYLQNEYSNVVGVPTHGKLYPMKLRCNAAFGCEIYYTFDLFSTCGQLIRNTDPNITTGRMLYNKAHDHLVLPLTIPQNVSQGDNFTLFLCHSLSQYDGAVVVARTRNDFTERSEAVTFYNGPVEDQNVESYLSVLDISTLQEMEVMCTDTIDYIHNGHSERFCSASPYFTRSQFLSDCNDTPYEKVCGGYLLRPLPRFQQIQVQRAFSFIHVFAFACVYWYFTAHVCESVAIGVRHMLRAVKR
jgi:hypothetical protein